MLSFLEYLIQEEILRPEVSLGIPRHEMPQITSDNIPEFLEFLESHGVRIQKQIVPADTLKPSQNELDADKARKLSLRDASRTPLLVSQDSYLLDGHHRWLKLVWAHKNVTILRTSLPILPLIDLAKKYKRAFYRTRPTTSGTLNRPSYEPSTRF